MEKLLRCGAKCLFFFLYLSFILGQLHAINRLMHGGSRKKVRVSAVDNFQGEENDIILLSLVRSNEEVSKMS